MGFPDMSDDEMFRAIADPTRRLILDELSARSEQTLYDLTARLLTNRGVGMSRQAIGKHLRVLRDAGLVQIERRGKFKVLRLDDAPLRRLHERWIPRWVSA